MNFVRPHTQKQNLSDFGVLVHFHWISHYSIQRILRKEKRTRAAESVGEGLRAGGGLAGHCAEMESKVATGKKKKW